ncbi:23S rRNA (pseudouridine(1915)-N(3))-methyltransferase RlmH [Candidatus Nitrosacidococcus sp. I8]|uniref:23S rRNA (pseudouridine(1915)-N(3))-methyltransferase RlmH n=1 Tax=Candidatus Nitrosacidococcus sp. I8 TaxID=2942908 RepID=UPI0022278D88|nr:23S rRNA (pseudouridine(1915)-N(3))-methyltransferase RlmH [Candidatus Nitrosacidococcus sp. I8]CAH9019468.1 Ribosomal RNA large subunit methyltransferase H [Candidatus Nitrosacidococcus sp. I8]
MHIHILAVGQRMPQWISEGYNYYVKRLSNKFISLRLIEVPAARRTKNSNVTKWHQEESERLLAAIPINSVVIACDICGIAWSTEKVASCMQEWMNEGKSIAIFIGGPDGLAPACLNRANYQWSLSPLTLPHGLVRIVLAEQIYRVSTLLSGHPYHRG